MKKQKHSLHKFFSLQQNFLTSKFSKKSKKVSHFKRNLLIFVSVFLIFMLLCLVRLWNYLADYQQTLPASLGDEILTAYKSSDTLTLRKYCTNLPDILQDDFVYQAYLRQYLDKDSLYYYETSNNNDDNNITYVINSNNKEFATLTITKTGETSKYGFPLYEITSLEQASQLSYTLTQAAGTTILFDGNPIDASYQISEDTVASTFDEIEAGPFQNITYEIPDYELPDNISATDYNNTPITLSWNDDHTSCSTTLLPTEGLAQELTKFAQSACEAYAVFATVKNASRDSFMSYLYPDCAYYQVIKGYDNTYGIKKDSDSFDNVLTSNIMQYSATEYTCDVTLTYHITQGSTEKDYPLSFTCYITSKNGSLQLLSLTVN